MVTGNIFFLFSVAFLSSSSVLFVHSWSYTPCQISQKTRQSSFLHQKPNHALSSQYLPTRITTTSSLSAVKQPETKESVEETTEKYGLEAGLFKSLQQKDGGQSAKDLLAKYGVAYLATSIPLAIISFSICYALVDSGVDVADLLSKVGIIVGDTGEKVGTFAIAYAAHKAASPIRFPPTVLLTPVVAKLIGKEPEASEDDNSQ
mmetsp:Transcript_13130/g.24673  ORF Transcript_13130/g.24673 Transcript_13130/m.24673 type:complete len:204 (-) Transcript_13130:3736-4347(-)